MNTERVAELNDKLRDMILYANPVKDKINMTKGISELTDQHLIAEYREITMVPAALKRTLNSKKGLNSSKIPINYTLKKGQVYFVTKDVPHHFYGNTKNLSVLYFFGGSSS